MPKLCCCCAQDEDSTLQSPLLADETPAKAINFAVLFVPELDAIFNDFEDTLNPFVEDRIALEKAEKAVKTTVRRFADVHFQASFKEYVKALKTSLADKGVSVQIERGELRFYGDLARVSKAEKEAENAIQQILLTWDKLNDMVPSVTQASEDAVGRAANLDIKAIVKRECASVSEAMKTAKKFKDNMKKIANAPKMVRGFCKEVEKIVKELMHAFGGGGIEDSRGGADRLQQGETREADLLVHRKYEQETTNKPSGSKTGAEENKSVETKKNAKKDANKKEEKSHKEIRFEKIGIPDIDRLFSDFASAVNPFEKCREKLQKARNSFTSLVKEIAELDADADLKAYVEEFKKKARITNVHLYIDRVDNSIEISADAEVPVPKIYKDAVRALNDVKKCAASTLDLEPEIQRGIESVLQDISNISPERDLKRALKFTELPKLPKKLKNFNNNRKMAQEAPEIVSNFFREIKKTLDDIKELIQVD